MNQRPTRREFLRETTMLTAAVAAMRATEGFTAESPTELPTIHLGSLEVSRMILGSNPFFGFAHGNPQGTAEEMLEWYTREMIMTVMDHAAENGITAVLAPCYERWIDSWSDYQANGGKLKIWIAQPDRLPMENDIEAAALHGAKAVAIQGARIDEQAEAGNWDVIRDWLELIKSHGLPAGMATHTITTHLEAQRREMPADFYNQSLYRPGNFVPQGAADSLEVIEQLAKPVVAFKVLAAGRVSPQDAFPPLFSRLKPQDGVCVAVFPRTRDEIAENAALTRNYPA